MPFRDQTRRKNRDGAVMLENYCGINVTTTENLSSYMYICVCCKKKLQTTVSKVDNFRGKWMRKNDENRAFRVKRMLSDVEQQSDERTPATKARVELKFSMVLLSEKVG